MLDHFLVPDFPVLANAVSLWTTFGPLRAVNSADMAVNHLCVRPSLSEKSMQYRAKRQFGTFNGLQGVPFHKGGNVTRTLLLVHFDLMFRGYVNVVDFLKHFIGIFVFANQSALKMSLPKLEKNGIEETRSDEIDR